MPRLLHLSDTHLGFQAYPRLTPDGLNQREIDLQEAFRRVVDDAIADPPDLVVHAGDLFDHPRPNNRAIAFALQQMRRLSEARIPTVLVSGNHDAPRMRETGSIFRVFDGLPHVHAVYRGEPERIVAGGVVVHAVPQAVTQEAFQRSLRGLEPSGPGPHVLVVHGTVLGVDGLFTSEFNEYQIAQGDLRPEFAYIALGHFHNFKRVAPNAYYSGSLEYCSFNEAGQSKVVLDVEAAADGVQVRARPVQSRPMHDLGTIEARGLEPRALADAVAGRLQDAPASGIVRLTVEDADRGVARLVDWDALRARRPDLTHLDLRVRTLDDSHAVDGGFELGTLSQEFEAFLARRPLPAADRERVREEALRCLSEAGGSSHAA